MALSNPPAGAERLTGAVEATNPKGIRVQGRWLNFSAYGPEVARPERGAVVEVLVNGKGFIRTLAVVGCQDGPSAPESHGAPPVARERLIARESALRAAVDFLAPRPEAKSPDVLRVAASFEAWLVRTIEAD